MKKTIIVIIICLLILGCVTEKQAEPVKDVQEEANVSEEQLEPQYVQPNVPDEVRTELTELVLNHILKAELYNVSGFVDDFNETFYVLDEEKTMTKAELKQMLEASMQETGKEPKTLKDMIQDPEDLLEFQENVNYLVNNTFIMDYKYMASGQYPPFEELGFEMKDGDFAVEIHAIYLGTPFLVYSKINGEWKIIATTT